MFVLGDVPVDDTLYCPFDTFDSDGASVTITGLAVTDIEIYKDGSATTRASDNGYALLDTDGIDFAGAVGLHGFSVDLSNNSDASFYAAGSTYWINVDAITVDSQTVRFTYHFTIGKLLRPTTAGRKLNVDANGRDDVGSWLGTAPLGLSSQRVQVDVQAIDGLASAATVLGLWLAEGVQTVADSGTTTTLVDAVLTQADGYWNGALLVFRSGTNAGRTAIITDFDAATDTLTFAPAVPDAVTTEGYVLIPGLGHADIAAISQNAAAANNLKLACDNYSATRGLTGTAVPAVAADAAGGLPLSDAGGLDLDAQIKTAIDLIVTGTPTTKYMGQFGPGVYIDSGAANTNTVTGTDGIVGTPVSTFAAARTIANAIGLNRYYIEGNSDITLAATHVDWEFCGVGAVADNIVNFGSQDVSRSRFCNLTLEGTQGGAGRIEAIECALQDPGAGATTLHIFALRCGLVDDVEIDTSNNNVFESCFSLVAGASTPSIIATGAAGTLEIRHYSGGIELKALSASHNVSIEGMGQVVFNANCNVNANVSIRGLFTITDNTAGMASFTQDAVVNMLKINTECDTALADYDGPTNTEMVAAFTEIKGVTWASGTDTLEAIRDRGDSAWITATGFSTHTAASVWAVDATGQQTQGTFGQAIGDPGATAKSIWQATVSDAAGVSVSADVIAVKTDTGNIAGRITAALFSGITSLAEWLGLLGGKQVGDSTARTEMRATGAGSGTFDETTDSQEAIRDSSGGDATAANQTTIITHMTDVKGTGFAKDTDSLVDLAHTGADSDTLETLSDQVDGIVGGTGTGARSVTITVDNGSGVKLENATVRLAEGGNTYAGGTNVSGVIAFSLDDATYAVTIAKAGHGFTPTTLVVDGTETITYSMSVDSISAPPNASTTTGVMTLVDEEGSVEQSVSVSVQIIDGPGTDGIGYDSAIWTETSSALGVVEFAGIIKGATYKIWRGSSKANVQTFTAPTTGDSFDLAEVIGTG